VRRARGLRFAGPLIALVLGVVVPVIVAEVGIRFTAPQPLQHIQLDDQIYFINRPFARFTYARGGEYSIDMTYNAWGFRGPIPDPNPVANVTRILLIGDSQTEGLQVRHEETYGAVLQRALERLVPGQRFEVVNLAVSAYGTHQEVLTLRRYGARVRPCWVVLGFYPGNDLSDNVRLPLLAEDANGVRLVEHHLSIGHRLWLGTKVWLASVSHLYTLSVAQIKAILSRTSDDSSGPDRARVARRRGCVAPGQAHGAVDADSATGRARPGGTVDRAGDSRAKPSVAP
jgi:hypothetical protein